VGWLLCLAAITAVTVVLTGGSPPSRGSVPSDAALAVRIAIGLGLVGFGIWRRAVAARGRATPRAEPRWQKGIDGMSLWFAALLAPITQPWGLMAAGVTVVMQADAASVGSVAMLAVFVVLASSTYLVLEVFAIVRRDRAHAIALALRAWIEAHTAQALVWGSVGIGAFLIGSGIFQLVT
jgi:hypothetical protein